MYLTASQITHALTLADLTDPARGPHAMQLVLDQIEAALHRRWHVPVLRRRAHPIVDVADNYDRLLIRADAVARDARYTRYVNERTVLRTHTTVMIPPLLGSLPAPDVILSCPGLVYRRDVVDRRHVGEPHQVDLWRIRTEPLTRQDLLEMVEVVLGAALPGRAWRTVDTAHPYTLGGMQIDVRDGDGWVEVGECGLAHPGVVGERGGLAMGLGLDRIVMLRKGLEDIRALRSSDPRIASQMLDLSPYTPVSSMPPVRRDLSIAVASERTAEELGDRARAALGEDASALESLEVVSSTPYGELPEVARARLGIDEGQRNVLVRAVLRPLDRTLTDAEANALNNRLYDALHEGTGKDYARG